MLRQSTQMAITVTPSFTFIGQSIFSRTEQKVWSRQCTNVFYAIGQSIFAPPLGIVVVLHGLLCGFVCGRLCTFPQLVNVYSICALFSHSFSSGCGVLWIIAIHTSHAVRCRNFACFFFCGEIASFWKCIYMTRFFWKSDDRCWDIMFSIVLTIHVYW